MVHIISRQGISEYIQSDFIDNRPELTLKWAVSWYHSSGGLKKKWFMGEDGCPIESIEFEMNERLCGAGKITLAYVDFPIDADDYVIVSHNGIKRYRALVVNTADPKGGEIELMPFSIRFQELLYNGSFTTETVAEIFQTIVEDKFDDTGIVYNSVYIDTGSTEPVPIEYEYEACSKIFKDLMKRLDDRYWGVDVNNILHIYADNTEIDQYLYQTDNPIMTEIEVDKDYDDIKVTRYQVYKKSGTSGQTARVGQVGYGGSYPILAIEKILRMKEDKIPVSEVLSDAEALDYAYAKLQAETQIPLSINMSNLDLSRYYPQVRHLVKCQDRTETILRTIIDCESTTGWSGDVTISLDTDDYCEGSGSISCEFTGAVHNISYDLSELKHWKNIQKIGFMMKADYAGDYLELFAYSGESPTIDSMTNTIDSYTNYIDVIGSTYDFTQTFHIPTGAVWTYYEFDVSEYPAFRFVGIRCIDSPPASSTINIDRIQIYDDYRTEYEANVREVKFIIDSGGGKCEAVLNKVNSGANDLLFALDEKIKRIEAVNQQ
jgi:hypothetical protein